MEEAKHISTGFRILVVIPTLGRRLDTLGRTLESIRSQSGVSVRILVVTHQASTELSRLSESCGAEIVVHPGKISAAINAGFALAHPEDKYVAWIGDDDLYRPDALTHISALLEHAPESVACYGVCDYIDVQGQVLFSRRPPALAPILLQFVPGLIKQETCLFRRETVERVGGLDESLLYTMDLDLLLRLRRAGSFACSPRVIAAFCWHPGSLTISNRRASLLEAQAVQRKHARGLVKLLHALLTYPIRYLILGLSARINRGIKVAGNKA